MEMSNYPDVDTWKRSNEEAYIYPDGKNVKINLKKAIPKSYRKFRKEDKEAQDSLQTFILERKLFFTKIDELCSYIDYFIEFFDEDKELPKMYMDIKHRLDSNEEPLTIIEFIKLINRKFFRDTSIKRNIYQMVNANYKLDVTIDQKTGRVFDGPNDFTNEEVKRLLAISIFMKFIIPVASQYVSTNTINSNQELNTLVTDIFVETFYHMGTRLVMQDVLDDDGNVIGQEEVLEDADDLLKKMYIFTNDKINKHSNAHSVLWTQQTALRGLTENKHTDTILIKHLLSNNMFKFRFNDNVISFLKSIVETQLICTINRVKYKADPVRVDNTKDFNGLSGIDKLEQSMTKIDESQIIRCDVSIIDIRRRVQALIGSISDEEVEYYMTNFNMTSTFHSMLFGYVYAKMFDGYTEIRNIGVVDRTALWVAAKRQLIKEEYKQLPDLLTSNIKGRTSSRLLQNTKYTNKLTSAEKYMKLQDEKYSTLKGFREEEMLSIISKVLNNIYTYVDYNDQEKTGEEIEFNEDIISAELLDFFDMI